MNRRPSIALVALACWIAPELAAEPALAQVRQIPLAERIQATFRATDLDKNGTISPQEAAKAGVPARSFAAYDKNKDRRLASDEFSAYYQKLIQRRAERARKAEEAKKKAEKQAEAKRKAQKDGPKKDGPKKDVQVKEAKKATVKTDGQVPAKAPKTGGAEAANKAPAKAASNDAKRVPPGPTAQGNAATLGPKGAPPAGKVADTNKTRSKRNGRNTEDQGKPQPELTPVQLTQTEQRARSYVQRLLAKGHVTVAEASELYQSLSVQVPAPTAPNQIAKWRESLNKSRDRVTRLVRAGSLTAAEGRAMYQLFEIRAKRAVAGVDPKTGKPRAQTPGPGSPAANTPVANTPVANSPGKAPADRARSARDPQGKRNVPTKPAPVTQDSQTPKNGNPGSTQDGDLPVSGMTPEEKAAHDRNRARNARAIIRTNEARRKLAEQQRAAEAAKQKPAPGSDAGGLPTGDKSGPAPVKDGAKPAPAKSDAAKKAEANQKRIQDARAKKRTADARRRIQEQEQARKRAEAGTPAKEAGAKPAPKTDKPKGDTPKGDPAKPAPKPNGAGKDGNAKGTPKEAPKPDAPKENSDAPKSKPRPDGRP